MRRTIFTLLILGLIPLGAAAQTQTPQQIQGLIASGQANNALTQLQTILQTHPNSGPAWYLEAEAQDAVGNETAARGALQHAQQIAPNLPFANPQQAAALKQHLGLAHHSGGFPVVFIIIGAFVALFILLRMMGRRRRFAQGAPYRDGFNAPPPMGGQPYGYGQQGGGVGSTLLSGLAAGAGFAVGERAVQDMFGGNGGQDMGQNTINPDDGLQGDPGWGGNDDNNNNGGGW